MKTIKKISAIISIAAIILANTITFAENAAINNTTASTSGLVSGVDTITITDAGGSFTSTWEIVSATITTLSGATVTTTLAGTWDDTNPNTSTLAIQTADLTDNLTYIISFTTASGDFGTTTLSVGTPTNDRLTVTASVQPVLKFDIESINESFGTLTTATWTVTTGIEVGTNAVNGLTITAQSTNGGLKSTSANHTINLSGNDSLYDAEGYFFSSTVAASADSLSGAVISWASIIDINTALQTETIYTANDPQNFDTTGGLYDVDFTVSAKIAESTPSASDYTDVIIFTATANF